MQQGGAIERRHPRGHDDALAIVVHADDRPDRKLDPATAEPALCHDEGQRSPVGISQAGVQDADGPFWVSTR